MDAPTRSGLAPRLALGYVALFFITGVYLPYWPVWLAERGAGPEQLGVLLGLGNWARLAAPWLGAWADRSGRATALLTFASMGVVASLAAFSFADGFAGLFVLSLALGLTFAPIIPLLDGIAVGEAARGRLDYGRVRLWGSISFIVASVAGGALLEGRPTALVLTTLQAASIVLVLAIVWLGRVPKAPRPDAEPAPSWSAVWRRPKLRTFLVTAAFLQSAHAVLYGFGTEHWLSVGIPESTIGWLWGVGVLAEVLLFAAGARVTAAIGSGGLLLLAGVGGLLRWAALARVTAVPLVFAIQVLHAASFAAMHLGAMAWIRDNLAGPAVHRATALYIAIASGVALGVVMPLAGIAFAHLRGDAYLIMAALAAAGTLGALRLGARATRG